MIDWNVFKSWLQQRLQQPLPGYEAQKKMMSVRRPDASEAPETARQSGVLLLLYPAAETVKLVLIERSADGGVHSGQLALPGGRKEEYDADIAATALREAWEEVSLKTEAVSVIGRLSALYIPVSNFVVNPVVAISDEAPVLVASEVEVANILRLDIDKVFSRKETVQVQASGAALTIRTTAYILDDEKFIWGATAMILSELETMLEERSV